MSDNIRDYEVSIWTLQDSYIATLKWSNSSHKGQIQEPKMTLSDDGTESLSFSIPMYLYVQDGDKLVKKENPIWYTVKDGILVVNMRKIKVIFNKTFGTSEDKKAAGERVFEFLITKITQTHETDNLICQVECEGLAFHELGKQGYKIELSSEVFYDRDNTYYNGDTDGLMIWYDNLHQPHADCPCATIDYWMNDLGIKHAKYNYKTAEVKQPKRISEEEYTDATKDGENPDYFCVDEAEGTKKYYKYVPVNCMNGLDLESTRTNLNPTEWYYEVQMDQSYYSKTDPDSTRRTDMIYEDPYVSSWNKDLKPMTVEPAREKERMIDANESNIYNLTQTIAENFEVFCRYEYSYDSRYQIIGRTIIFYNTFYGDYNSKYFEHLNYPQSTSSVTREYDGTEITTKMYVRPETDDSSVTGQISIIDSNANPTKEDYVMNFDYLHNIGTISDEQYNEIKNYNLKMKHFNEGYYIDKSNESLIINGGILLQDGYYRKGDRIYREKEKQWEQAGLITLQEQLLAKQDRKIEVDAKLTIANNSYTEALERVNDATQHIGGDTGRVDTRDQNNPSPESLSKYKNKNGKEFYQLSLSDTGVIPDSIRMYKKWNDTDHTFSDYTSDLSDIPDSDLKELFDHTNLDFRFEKESGQKALGHYMKVAGLDSTKTADVNTAKETLNGWYNKMKSPGGQFAATEVPKFVSSKITYKNRPAAYAAAADATSPPSDDCTLKTDAIGWVLHILGKAAYKRVDDKDWKTYVLQVKSPTEKEYYLKSIKSSTTSEKFYIGISTWNEWVGCRLQWCLAASKGVLIKDIQMKKQDDKSYLVSSKLSWAKLADGDTLTVTVNNRGRVTWTATISSIGLNNETSSTFKGLKGSINYIDLLESVGIYHFPNRITSFKVVTDDNGNPTGINRIPIKKGETLVTVYLTYDYSPMTYYRNIREMWEKKLDSAATDKLILSEEQEALEKSIDNLKEVIRIMLKDKFEETRKFDHLMGPALRESYWQPEDYHDYGDFYSQHLNTIFFNNNNTELPQWRDEQISAGFFWDNELFPEEEKGYYYLGVDTGETAEKHYYPCINLIKFFKTHEETPSAGMVTIDDTGGTISVEDEMQPITSDSMIPTEENELIGISSTTAGYEIVGAGLLTRDEPGTSYIAGIRGGTEIQIDHESYSNDKIPSAEDNFSAVKNTDVFKNSNSITAIEDFIQNFHALTFSYYNDGIDKQVKKSKEYNPSAGEYQIISNENAEYSYDNTLFAKVVTENSTTRVQWSYKIRSIATTDGSDTKDIINEVDIDRSETDRVFYTVGSKTAEDAFVENDEIKLMFLRRTEKSTERSVIIPVLMLKCLDGVSNDTLHYIKQSVNYDEADFINEKNDGKLHSIHPGAQPMLGYYNQTDDGMEFNKIGKGIIQPKHWINFDNSDYTYEVVYPRIKINSLQLKTSTVALTLNYDLLKQYEDYYIFTRKTDHLITIKPHIFFELHGSATAARKKILEAGLSEDNYLITTEKKLYYLSTSNDDKYANYDGWVNGTVDYIGDWFDDPYAVDNLNVPIVSQTNYIDEMSVVSDLCFLSSTLEKIQRPLRITYAISNGGTRTYLDALKVIKENSQPKVTYNVTPNIANSVFTHTLYNKLGQIVGINDTELKFNNVFGYISSVELNLDRPQEDSIEVKNYTNKFEDLFSSITAQTEAMKKNSGILAGFASGNIPTILQESVTETVTDTVTTPTIINNIMQEFDGPEAVEEVWNSILGEVNTILNSGSEGIDELLSVNNANAQIFGTFIKNISDQVKPAVFSGDPTTITDFKPGDICYGPDGRIYVAASGDAFMPVYDGNVSKIVGASVEWDADAGTVNIEGATKIDIKSGNNIDIAANSDINIVGNRSVNIGGATINIGSAKIKTSDDDDDDGDIAVGGVNIVSSLITDKDEDDDEASALSGVFINPYQISLLSSNIVMEGSKRIVMSVSQGTAESTSGIQIDVNEGIWIGSGKGIDIYTEGEAFSAEEDENDPTQIKLEVKEDPNNNNKPYQASLSIHPERILMGLTSMDKNATIIRMEPSEVVIAAGSVLLDDNGTDNSVDVSKGLVGARFTNDSIGLATQSDDNSNLVNAILMNGKGITIGSGMTTSLNSDTQDLITTDNNNTSNDIGKSWVRIDPKGIALGSLAEMYINTNNLKLQTKQDESEERYTILAVGSDLQGITGKTTLAQANNKGTVNMLVTKDIAYFRGTVYATNLYIGANDEDINTALGTATTNAQNYVYNNFEDWMEEKADGAGLISSSTAYTVLGYVKQGTSYNGFIITTDGVKVSGTGSLNIDMTNFKLDDNGNTKFIASYSTIAQSYYITNTDSNNEISYERIGYILARDASPVKFEDLSGDNDTGAEARALSPTGTNITAKGIGLLANDNSGIFSYPALNEYSGGVVIYKNADIVEGLRVGSYESSNGRRGSIMTGTYIKANKIYIDSNDLQSDSNIVENSGSPKIIFSFTKHDETYKQYQTKIYISMDTETTDPRVLSISTRSREKAEATDKWPDWANTWSVPEAQLKIGGIVLADLIDDHKAVNSLANGTIFRMDRNLYLKIGDTYYRFSGIPGTIEWKENSEGQEQWEWKIDSTS